MTFTIHDLPLSERPRERLHHYGSSSLSLPELLAVILGNGTRGEPVVVLSQKLLSKFGSLENIQNASLQDLQSVRGLGFAKAAQIKACFEIARRLRNENTLKKRVAWRQVASPEEVYNVVKDKIPHWNKEHFMVLSVDSRHKLISLDTIFVGSLNASVVHPREVFDVAVHRHAACIIIVHNHPSGSIEPSKEDIQVTKILIEAGKIMGIEVIDHLIVTKEEFMSMKRGGII